MRHIESNKTMLASAAALMLAATGAQAGWPGDGAPCRADMVKVGATCIDRYEASAWLVPNPTTTNKALVGKIVKGKATLADLTAGGATQLGCTVTPFGPFSHAAYPGNFPADGNWTALPGSSPPTPGVYAASIPGVLPSTCTTWFQAEQACALSNKRLARNQEWQRAAAGTKDPGANNGLANTMCHTSAPILPGVGPRNTGLAGTTPGDATTCVSNWGAQDMVGNVWEWVGDWADLSTGTSCTDWTTSAGIAGDDVSCFGGDGAAGPSNIPGALIRGGDWGNGTIAGVFAVGALLGPFWAVGDTGFRCAR